MKRVRILVDQDPMSPREWDNAGRMICWHGKYNLGDDHNYDCGNFLQELAFEACGGLEDEVDRLENEVWDRLYAESGFHSQYDATQAINGRINELVEKALLEGYVMLPLYLYDHSDITMSTGQFSCPWDSGQVGWIICDNETIKREFNGDRDLAEKHLRCEVSTYDEYLTGNVYGFIVEETDEFDEFDELDWDNCDELDSCWGFYGSDVHTNGMAKHFDDELIGFAANADFE